MAFIDTQNNIIDDLDGRTDLTTQIQREINRACHHYAKDNLSFLEQRLDFYLSLGQDTYDSIDGVPINIKDIYIMNLYDENSATPQKYRIYPATLSDVDWNSYPTNGNGLPQFYSLFGGTIRFDRPSQSDNYHIYMDCVQEYVNLVNPTDTNNFLDKAPELIEARATRMIYTRVLKTDNQALLASYLQMEADAYQAMIQKSEKLTIRGTIQPSTF